MKFAQENLDEGYVVTAYDDQSISINHKPFSQSFIVSPQQLDADWPIGHIDQLTAVHIEQVLVFEPELVVIGTGNRLCFPAVEHYADLIRQGIGVEFMDNGAACRTYNILMSEGRNAVAAFIL
jgi:uncharacterized protein